MDSLTILRQRLTELGFNSVSELFDAFPNENFGAVLRKVARPVSGTNRLDIPLMLLKECYANESIETRRMKDFARDSLYRSLCEHIQEGWGRGKNWSERRAKSFSNWHTPAGYDEECNNVWHALKELPPPIGWKPVSGEDKLLMQAFEQGWPM